MTQILNPNATEKEFKLTRMIKIDAPINPYDVKALQFYHFITENGLILEK